VSAFDPTHSSRKTAREQNSGKQREIDEFDAAFSPFRGENDSSFSSVRPDPGRFAGGFAFVSLSRRKSDKRLEAAAEQAGPSLNLSPPPAPPRVPAGPAGGSDGLPSW
jgi:hypothetical protein